MNGETLKCEAICLAVHPFSRTSHVVNWLTPNGRVDTVVKGAVRPKSAFLGQYDANYTCEIVYYTRGTGGLHALRACAPLVMREYLRTDYRAALMAEYYRYLAAQLAPLGREAQRSYRLLGDALDALASATDAVRRVTQLVRVELQALDLAGIRPDFMQFPPEVAWAPFALETASFAATDAGHCVRISRQTADFLKNTDNFHENINIPLDAARVIGVFYAFHLDCATDVRRTVLREIAKSQ